ncbi:carboxymethylenebutenolidase [Caulobacter ginsengisoli]|uniref:Carboxymethylenebutenolidase n=1 Tax=Caulobacter ginsengisoli TaxID=400775 RepID=A0ABU0IVL5_9CAUL|nr:dienelactone hydrolase family protein [Caulobacter ginsengisoli]MDQ0465391.1 carboxymethylenebutenolidase [Caulobacter ginsengisoli]
MRVLNRPEGPLPGDFDVSRRSLGGLFFAGYAVAAFSAEADPIHTDETGLICETVMVPASDRSIPAYVARPRAKGKFPTVMVISEVFGIHEYIRDICRRLAKLGYVAMATDFFVRAGDPAPVTDFAEIRRIVSAASDAQVMTDLDASVQWAMAQGFVDPKKMAITGFCWGGAVVWLACERFRYFKCGVAWYGRLSRPADGQFLSEPERRWPLELAPELKCPVLGLYGGKDQGIPQSDIEKMRQAMIDGRKTNSQLIVYPEAQHGFHADYRPSYNAEAAADGWKRMLDYFAFYKMPGKSY